MIRDIVNFRVLSYRTEQQIELVKVIGQLSLMVYRELAGNYKYSSETPLILRLIIPKVAPAFRKTGRFYGFYRAVVC